MVMTVLISLLECGDGRIHSSTPAPSARERLLMAALQQVELNRHWSFTFDADKLSPICAHGLGLALTVLLEANNFNLNDPCLYDIPISEICSTLSAMRKRHPSVASGLYSIVLNVRQRQLRLSEGTEEFLASILPSNLIPQMEEVRQLGSD